MITYSYQILSRVIVAGVLCLGANASSAVYAQTAQDRAARQADQIQRDQASENRRRQIEQSTINNAAPDGGVATAPTLDQVSSDETCIEVNTITVDGVTLFKQNLVDAIVAPSTGRCVSLSDLNNILKQLTFVYVEKGYIASRAYLPEQDLADGTLEIVVIEGRLEEIIIDGDAKKYRNQVRTAFPSLKGKPANLRDIEQGLDQLNRLKSNNAIIELQAGKEAGGSVLAVDRQQSKRWQASVSSDNLGSSSTGEYQTRVDIAFDDVLGLNDKWNVGYQRSMENNPINLSESNPGGKAFNVGFSLPYGYWTLSVDGSLSEYKSSIPGLFSDIETSGQSRSISANLSRILHRDQVSSTSVASKFQWKDNDNFILGSRVDISSRILSIAGIEFLHSRQFLDGQLSGSVTYSQGLNAFGAFDDSVAPIGSPNGQFSKVDFYTNYYRPFKIKDQAFSFNTNISGQWSKDSLFGSEQIAFGGYSTVRGLREAAVFGNDGILGRNELALALPSLKDAKLSKSLGQFELYGAVDIGRIFADDTNQIESGNLAGAAIGLRSRGGNVSVDFSYTDIIGTSNNFDAVVSDSGLFFIKTSLSF